MFFLAAGSWTRGALQRIRAAVYAAACFFSLEAVVALEAARRGGTLRDVHHHSDEQLQHVERLVMGRRMMCFVM